MDVLGSEGGGVSRIRDTVGEQCIGISLWDFPIRSLGPPQAPVSLLSQVWRTRLTAWLFRSLAAAVPAHPRRKDGGCRRRSKSFSWCGFCMGIDIFSFAAYNNSTRQATACVCQSVEVRECAGRHCLTELARGVVQ